MNKRSKKSSRCPHCRAHVVSCFCADIPRLTLKTHVVLVMHRREVKKPTATGPLAIQALVNSELYIHGQTDDPLDLSHLHTRNRRLLMLFPSELARPLSHELVQEDPRPITLVVPDGNWRQASRIPVRVPGLAETEHVVLPKGQVTSWGIRRETREDGLATFEAIARALGILESQAVQEKMEALFALMVQTTLAAR
jgi:DTW domain-containing protein YfiP